jgi:hypothetical protein
MLTAEAGLWIAAWRRTIAAASGSRPADRQSASKLASLDDWQGRGGPPGQKRGDAGARLIARDGAAEGLVELGGLDESLKHLGAHGVAGGPLHASQRAALVGVDHREPEIDATAREMLVRHEGA